MDLLFAALIPLPVLITWLHTVGLPTRSTPGTVIYDRPLRFLARAKMLSIPLIASATLTIGLIASGRLHWFWGPVPWIVTVLVMNIPVSYVLTTIGIRTSIGSFHRWTQFAGVHRSSAGATLARVRSGPGYPIFLVGERGDDEFVSLLTTLVRDAYKGKVQQSGPTEPASTT